MDLQQMSNFSPSDLQEFVKKVFKGKIRPEDYNDLVEHTKEIIEKYPENYLEVFIKDLEESEYQEFRDYYYLYLLMMNDVGMIREILQKLIKISEDQGDEDKKLIYTSLRNIFSEGGDNRENITSLREYIPMVIEDNFFVTQEEKELLRAFVICLFP